MRKLILTTLCTCFSIAVVIAKENVNSGHRTGPIGGGSTLASCNASTAQTDLDINNIRTKIFINGDMWWDLVGTATYEVPKGSGKHSLFAGAAVGVVYGFGVHSYLLGLRGLVARLGA